MRTLGDTPRVRGIRVIGIVDRNEKGVRDQLHIYRSARYRPFFRVK